MERLLGANGSGAHTDPSTPKLIRCADQFLRMTGFCPPRSRALARLRITSFGLYNQVLGFCSISSTPFLNPYQELIF
jgi:hypothetical protein